MGLNALEDLVSNYDYAPRDLEKSHKALIDVSSFIEQEVIGKTPEETLPSLNILIFAIRAAISPSLILNGDAVSHLLDLLASVEEYRLALTHTADEAIGFDTFYTKRGDSGDPALPQEERTRLEKQIKDSSVQREVYVTIVGSLCRAHISHLLTSDPFDAIEFVAYMNHYFPWISSRQENSAPLHLRQNALSATEIQSIKETANDCRDDYRKVLNWAKKTKQKDQSLQDAFCGVRETDLIETTDFYADLSGLILDYLKTISKLNKDIHDIFPAST
ncbi:hypothetical protein BDZ89DRAFT_1129384 [Hymenopellis radicata]|nr:hypothetical protein BDZ89DRAFT_1129384 [Hymenopellis radicata]